MTSGAGVAPFSAISLPLARALSLGLLLAGCAHTRAECSVHGGPAWREITSEHFLVSTDLEPAAARAAALELEKARKALLLAMNTRVDPPERLTAIVLRSRSELAEFRDHILGFMTFDDRGPLIVVAGTAYFVESAPDLRVVTHEMTHLFAAHSFARQPRWFSEGLAGYLETMLSNTGTNEVLLGDAHLERLEYARYSGVLPLAALWTWDPKKLDEDYASSWLWVHFLINRHPEELGAFEAGLANAVEPRRAWAEAFGRLSDPVLEQELERYLMGGAYAVTRVGLGEVSQALTERALTAADVHALRAQLSALAHNDVTPEERQRRVQHELTTALRLDASNVRAAELQILATSDGAVRLTRARALARGHPTHARAWKLLAQSLAVPGVANSAEAVQAWRTALSGDPNDPTALVAVALEELRARNLDQAQSLAEYAVQSAPWNPSALTCLATVLAARGRCAEAISAQQQGLEVLGDAADKATRKTLQARLGTIERSCRDGLPPPP